jgi:hypothetical protein
MEQTVPMNHVQTETQSRISMPGLLLRLEGVAMFVGILALYSRISGDWLAFILLLLVPDLAMIGYKINLRTGAVIYNVAHFYALPLTLGLIALFGGWTTGVTLALIWMAHISMDRAVGYGLKYATMFKDTHLGRV